MKKNIKNRILSWFIAFSILLLVIVSLLNVQYYKEKENKNLLIKEFHLLENKLLKIFNNSNAFFRNEITNPNFFITGESKYLSINQKLSSELLDDIKYLNEFSLSQNIPISSNTTSLINSFQQFNSVFNQIAQLILERGYKDYGTEGKMRDHIHKLEQLSKIDQTKVLMLRRHEKDYIIRHEDQYVEKLNKLAKTFKFEIKNSKIIDESQKDSVIQIIDTYTQLFSRIVSLEKEIGIRNNSALKKELDDLALILESQIETLIQKVEKEKSFLLHKAKLNFIYQFILAILFSIFASLIITRNLTRCLINLTHYISEITKNDFKRTQNFNSPECKDAEVLMIYNEFNNMLDNLEKREFQRDQALKDVSIQQNRFKQMADMLPIILFEADKNDKLTYINKRFEESLGYSQEQILNLSLTDILKSKKFDNDLHRYKYLEAYETIATTADGVKMPVLFYSSLKQCDDILDGLRGIIVDITDRVKIFNDLVAAKQKAEESDRLKTAFLANMSHEIRTPMNAIIGFTDLLKYDDEDQRTRQEYLSLIQDSGKLLLKVIDDIIDISKIEAGKLSIDNGEFDLDKLMLDIHLNYENISQTMYNKVKIICQIPENSPNIILYSDPIRLRQIITNLLNNALKFTNKGSITYGYTVNKKTINFFVKDTGIGIPSEKLNMIFERFRQVDESLNRKYSGTGLGLAIVKNLLELMGGRITVQSEVGIGTSFYFTLPAKVKVTEKVAILG